MDKLEAIVIVGIIITVLLLICYVVFAFLLFWFKWNYRTFKYNSHKIFAFQSVINIFLIGFIGWKLYEETRFYDEVYVVEKILEFSLPKEYTINEKWVKRDYLPFTYKVSFDIQFEEKAKNEFLQEIQNTKNTYGYWKRAKNSTIFEFEATKHNYDDFYTDIYMSFEAQTGDFSFFLTWYNS
jgi:hypothetical protein